MAAARRRWPPKQLERVRRGVYERRRPRTASGEGWRRRGCVSISLGTVILQRLPKLKRLDCFQRVRMLGTKIGGVRGAGQNLVARIHFS